jgi:hypothetical protein
VKIMYWIGYFLGFYCYSVRRPSTEDHFEEWQPFSL